MNAAEPRPMPVSTPPQPMKPIMSRRVGAIFQICASGWVPSSLFAPAILEFFSGSSLRADASGWVLTEPPRERQRRDPTLARQTLGFAGRGKEVESFGRGGQARP